jgi:Domain of unknown function (DUF4397)
MKNYFLTLKNCIVIGILLLIAVAFIACNKDVAINNTPNAGILAFNSSPDREYAGFAVSGLRFTNTPVPYAGYTGGYQPIYPGMRTIEAFDFYSGAPLAYANRNFEGGHYYSTFLVGENGAYENIIAEDNLDSLDASLNKAYIRYVNAVADSIPLNNISISVAGEIVTSSEDVPFKTISAFTPVSPGSLEFIVSDEVAIKASRTFDVESNRVYTVMLVRAATSDSLQIRYVQNGNIVQ